MVQKVNQKILIPNKVDELWLADFNAEHAHKDVTATVIGEDWLDKPDGEIGSGYYSLSDKMGADGWWQIITGKVVNAAWTNVPDYHDTSFANVLALREASILEGEGLTFSLATGRLILSDLTDLRIT